LNFYRLNGDRPHNEDQMNAKDFLTIKDFSPAEIQYLLTLGRQVKTHPTTYSETLKRKTLAMIFEKPSLRTRVSFDVGIQQLGGFSIYLSPAEINLGKRESVYDVAKNLERMVQGIMIRTFAHEIVEQMAEYADIPVINGLTDYSHPCQALADYMTMWEAFGKLQGLKIAYVGDGNNVAHSLMFTGAQVGAHVWVATPPGYEPKADAARWASERGRETGATCTVTNDPQEAVSGADVVYTDVWASMGQEAETAKRKQIFAPFQVNQELFQRARNGAIFLHCLPAHRGEEVTADVIDSPRSLVFQQAENRLHAQKAIMIELMKGEFVKLPDLAELRELAHV
jgi:ornithine carbamoyltransferase